MRAGVEIDVIEYLATPKHRNKALHTIHWDGYGENHKSKHVEKLLPGLGEGFHTFGLEWTPEEYIFYVDGQETGRMREAVTRRNEYLILSLEVGEWADDIAAAKLPDSMVVDYVRVWQRQPTCPCGRDAVRRSRWKRRLVGLACDTQRRSQRRPARFLAGSPSRHPASQLEGAKSQRDYSRNRGRRVPDARAAGSDACRQRLGGLPDHLSRPCG